MLRSNALGPIVFDEPDQAQLVDVRVGGRGRVEQQHAARSRSRRKRLALNPPAHGARESVDRKRRVIMRGLRVGQRLEGADDRGRARARVETPRPRRPRADVRGHGRNRAAPEADPTRSRPRASAEARLRPPGGLERLSSVGAGRPRPLSLGESRRLSLHDRCPARRERCVLRRARSGGPSPRSTSARAAAHRAR